MSKVNWGLVAAGAVAGLLAIAGIAQMSWADDLGDFPGFKLAIGTTNTGPAAVVNAGTAQAPVLNFTVPEGPQGPTGATGATGPAGPASVGAPASRSLSTATAYQCTNVAKPCLISVTVSSSVSFSVSGTTTNTANLLVGSTNGVASGTGSVVGTYTNAVGGTIVIGLTVTNQATQSYMLAVPVGYYFAVRQTSGTISIVNAWEQVLG